MTQTQQKKLIIEHHDNKTTILKFEPPYDNTHGYLDPIDDFNRGELSNYRELEIISNATSKDTQVVVIGLIDTITLTPYYDNIDYGTWGLSGDDYTLFIKEVVPDLIKINLGESQYEITSENTFINGKVIN